MDWRWIELGRGGTGVDFLRAMARDDTDEVLCNEFLDGRAGKGSINVESVNENRGVMSLLLMISFKSFSLVSASNSIKLLDFSFVFPLDHFFFFAAAPWRHFGQRQLPCSWYPFRFEPWACFLSLPHNGVLHPIEMD